MTDQQRHAPEPGEFGPDFGRYIRLVPAGDILLYLSSQADELVRLLRALSDAEALVHHAPYTWSIKQVVGHINDCERIFGYRALRMARNDSTPRAGFDEQAFMQHANFDRWPLGDLLGEFESLRRSHIAMFRHLVPEAWQRQGTANEQPMSVRAFAYAIAGHAQHHLDILRKRLNQG